MTIEKLVIDFLEENMEVPVYAERPEKPDKYYLIVEKTGSNRNSKLITSTIAIQSYAPRLTEAADLNDAVIKTMEGMIMLDDITKVRLSSDYNFTNSATKQHRYQALHLITHYDI